MEESEDETLVQSRKTAILRFGEFILESNKPKDKIQGPFNVLSSDFESHILVTSANTVWYLEGKSYKKWTDHGLDFDVDVPKGDDGKIWQFRLNPA
jgi:hypothetical protein